ncbi:hypothetical protein QR680_012277 [Steinernema hermaphroditum]|uniref:Uncharacterized protein n=1 Tax=Steinernema hermaphroditum TaxID=289476 RepID=A0AA39I345_9BILA|nr:hypothetical protein QR680_012277 [Steinernema hermaphroditum]
MSSAFSPRRRTVAMSGVARYWDEIVDRDGIVDGDNITDRVDPSNRIVKLKITEKKAIATGEDEGLLQEIAEEARRTEELRREIERHRQIQQQQQMSEPGEEETRVESFAPRDYRTTRGIRD